MSIFPSPPLTCVVSSPKSNDGVDIFTDEPLALKLSVTILKLPSAPLTKFVASPNKNVGVSNVTDEPLMCACCVCIFKPLLLNCKNCEESPVLKKAPCVSWF